MLRLKLMVDDVDDIVVIKHLYEDVKFIPQE